MAQLILILIPTSLLGLIAVALCLPKTAMAQETANTVTKVTTGAAYAGSTAPAIMGMSGEEWQVIGVVGSLILGFITWLGSMIVNWYFKREHLRLAQALAARGKPISEDE